MKALSSSIQNLPWKRFLKYAVTGGTAIAIDFAIYFVLTRFGNVPYLSSRAISFSLALVWNFTVNRNWTFQAQAGRVSQQAPRFLIVMALTLLLNLVFMRIGVSYLHLNDLFVLLVVTFLTAIGNFSAHYLWSYKT